MTKNLGTPDRVLRLAIAVGLAALAFRADSRLWAWGLGIAALFTLYEAVASWCVLYALFGRSTCPVQLKK